MAKATFFSQETVASDIQHVTIGDMKSLFIMDSISGCNLTSDRYGKCNLNVSLLSGFLKAVQINSVELVRNEIRFLISDSNEALMLMPQGRITLVCAASMPAELRTPQFAHYIKNQAIPCDIECSENWTSLLELADMIFHEIDRSQVRYIKFKDNNGVFDCNGDIGHISYFCLGLSFLLALEAFQFEIQKLGCYFVNYYRNRMLKRESLEFYNDFDQFWQLFDI